MTFRSDVSTAKVFLFAPDTCAIKRGKNKLIYKYKYFSVSRIVAEYFEAPNTEAPLTIS